MIRSALCLVLIGLCPMPAAEVDLAALDGARLVALLEDPATAQRAHYELWRRAEPQEDKGWIAFTRNHYSQRTVLCPQGQGRAPITLVLFGFLSSHLRQGDYPIEDLDTLFPAEPASSTRAVAEPAIDAYTADGRQVTPFGGNNVLQDRGVLADVDGDGFIERIDTTNCGVEGVKHVEVVEIHRVREVAEPLFTAVINWGEDEWTIAVVPPTAGRPGEVRLGPTDAAGQVQTRAVVRVDPATGGWALVGKLPAGHVRQLNHSRRWEGLKALQIEGLVFIADPSAGREAADGSTGIDDPRLDGRAIVPPAPPYAYRSLGTDPLVVAAFMGKGRSIRDLEAEQRLADVVPEGVWTLPPREAALALAEANRSPAHRQRFRLAVDGRDGRRPPEILVIDLSSDSPRCYHDTRSIWRFHAGPAEAMLTLARVEQGGVVFRDPVNVLPVYDLRSQNVDPALARQVAGVLWWLDRIRSFDRVGERGSSMMMSTADGRGLLRVTDGDGVEQYSRADTLWSGSIPERWRSAFDHETTLNLARLLLLKGLVARLIPAWPAESKADPAALHMTVARLLARPQAASNGIMLRVVEAVGIQAWQDLDGELQRLASALAQDLPPLRTRAQVEADIQTLQGDRDTSARVSTLYQELFSLGQRQAQAGQSLAAAIVEARARIVAAGDTTALEGWACSDRPGWQWALARLHGRDRTAYVRALEARMAASTGHQARSFYAAIAAADPARATVLAAALPANQADPLSVEAFASLQQADALTEVGQRVQALIAVLLDPQQGWEVRGKALELLVPVAEPQRYPQPAIDTALAAVLAPDKADETVNFTLGYACQALARRGQVAQAGRILELLDATGDSYVRSYILAAAVDLAQQAGGAVRERLARWITAQLERTNMCITELLWAAWALDLRELAPAIAGLSTASENDLEGPMASSHGGTPRLVAEHRYHFARQISQLWSEPEPASRAVLLLGFGHRTPQAWEDPARTRRRMMEFTAMQGDATVRRVVEAWCAAWPGINHDPATTAHLAKATSVIGVALTEPAK